LIRNVFYATIIHQIASIVMEGIAAISVLVMITRFTLVFAISAIFKFHGSDRKLQMRQEGQKKKSIHQPPICLYFLLHYGCDSSRCMAKSWKVYIFQDYVLRLPLFGWHINIFFILLNLLTKYTEYYKRADRMLGFEITA
jgi:hypothetical protein